MKPSRRHHAFTLVELLAVMFIIALVLVFTVPAVTSRLQALQLTQATGLVVEQLTVARQDALTKSHSVEVRLYSYADPGAPGTAPVFCAMQNFQVSDDGTFLPLGKAVQLPGTVLADPNPQLSSVIGMAQSSPAVPTSAAGASLRAVIPRAGTNYTAVTFRFLPDGSTNLPTGSTRWCVTLHLVKDGGNLGALPSNFATLQIDPYNGHVVVYRP